MRNGQMITVAATLLLTGCAGTHPAGTPITRTSTLRHEIDKVLADSIFDHSQAQIKVISAKTGKPLYERNSEQLIHPASTLKLFTTAAALHELTKEYRFKTVIYSDSVVEDSVISGNIYIKGFGNPDFTSANLDSLVGSIAAKGIKMITGGVVADVSFFDEKQKGSGWSWDDEPAAYAPFVSPLTINDNCVTVTVTPSDSVQVELIPANSYMTVINSAKVVDTVKTPLKISRRIADESNEITIEGEILRNSSPVKKKLSVWKPELYTATLFEESLKHSGIAVANPPKIDTVPSCATELAVHVQPIGPVLINMNKSSDNLSAELILKTMGTGGGTVPGTFPAGVSAVKRYLNSVGIDTMKCALVDGSGMSYYNLITPAMMVTLLDSMENDSINFSLFYESLPVAGVDGTLADRMKNSSAEKMIRAKTGSFSGVSTLAGYVDTKNRDRLIFCISMQDFVYPTSLYRKAQDRIGAILANFNKR